MAIASAINFQSRVYPSFPFKLTCLIHFFGIFTPTQRRLEKKHGALHVEGGQQQSLMPRPGFSEAIGKTTEFLSQMITKDFT